jgi:hypothetical protein
MDIRFLIRKIPDYPGPGTTYYGLTSLRKRAPAS